MSKTQSKKAEFIEARNHAWKLSDKIEAAYEAGKVKRAAYLTLQFLNSFYAKYAAVVTANRKLPRHRRRPLKELRGIAAKLDPWAGSQEEVVVHFKPKESDANDFRPIMDFGIENRALQYLVASALLPQTNLHPHQYGNRGGRNSAVEAMMEALSDGYVWIAEADIKNCFPSLDGEALPGLLPLPRQVTRQIVTSQSLSLSPGNIINLCGYDSVSEWKEDDFDPVSELLVEARQGIPQGSAVSSIVVEMLLAPVVAELSNMGKPAAYVDNILVMAREEKNAVSMLKTLGAALESHPAGPLKPHMKTSLEKHKSFDFLGYSILRKFGNIVAVPSVKNLAKFDWRYNHDLKKATDPAISPGARKRTLYELGRYVRSWTAAFSLWEGAKALRDKRLTEIKHASGKFNIPNGKANPSNKAIPLDSVKPPF